MVRPTSATAVAVLAVASVGCIPTAAFAAGIAVARFGAEHGHPTTDNPTAIYYNPAGLALGEGHRLFVDGALALRSVSYERDPSAISDPAGTPADGLAANSGTASLFNFAGAPFLGAATDLGVEGLGLALAFYVPFGGGASWDQNSAYAGNTTYPGAVDGQARWFSIHGNMRSIYVTLGAAYRIPSIRLSFGATGSLVYSEVDTLRARNADGTDDLVAGGTLKEGRSHLKVSGLQGAFGLGMIWEPTEGLFLGLSYQSRPNVSGGMELRGTLRNALGTAPVSESEVTFTQDLPDSVRIGGRFRLSPELELRLFGDWTQWQSFRRQCILDANDPDRECERINGGAARPGSHVPIAILERRWVNTWGVRGGVSWWPFEQLELMFGAGYDSNAIPDQTLDPALVDMDKGTLSAGASYAVLEKLIFHLTFTQIIYASRDTRGAYKILAAPSAQPDGGGIYNQSISLLNVAVEWAF